MPNDSDGALVLNYIDKLYASLNRLWDISGRLTTVAVTLALLTLITASNVVTVGEDFSVLGIPFKVAVPTLLAGSVIAIAILLYVVQRLTEQQDRLREEITKLYKQIGLEERGLEKEALTPLQRPSAYSALAMPFAIHAQNDGASEDVSEVSAIEAYTSLAILFSVGELLPLVAQVLAWLKAASLWEWPYWVWLLVLPICSNLYRLVSTYSEQFVSTDSEQVNWGLMVGGILVRILVLIVAVAAAVEAIRWSTWIGGLIAIAIGAFIIFPLVILPFIVSRRL
jgi:uncharacterized integral membrane protein